ncbi:hypothetical protein MVEN_01592900 [Mycena venus]|uniref:DUF6589 domain-containing protein n=1 Tax=Mycena venus TaxID=2733690 RepID=A0A8H6XQN9_9AGAR|nr:hypothetical protein MVEN_01592900 [Mycena venus]
MTNTYTKIHNLLASLRQDWISPVDILLQVLDPDDIVYDRYRGNLYRDDSTKLASLIEIIMSDHKGKQKLSECMEPYLVEFACDTVAEEMETRQKKSILPGIQAVTPAFMETWNPDEEEDHTPFLSQILQTAAQTDRAKLQNKKKKPDKVIANYFCHWFCISTLLQSSNRCLAFQAAFGLFLWSTRSARQTIDAAFRCGLSVCYDGVLKHISLTADDCMKEAIEMSNELHSFCYDNMNISTSIFTEQRGALRAGEGHFRHIWAAIQASECEVGFNRDIRPSLDSLHSFCDQLVVFVVHCLGSFSKDFQNLDYHDEVYIDQLKRDPESLSKYAIPGFYDQLTNACVCAGQLLCAQDINAWECCEIFQLGFGLFHLCLNLVWAILHIHRGSVNEAGSLTYFFALMEKARLGNDQPDYRTLLAALTQVLDGLLLNAWRWECGFSSFERFAQSKPSPEKLHEIASWILTNYVTPMAASTTPETSMETSDDESVDSGADSDPQPCTPSQTPRASPVDPKDDIAHQNVRLLTRDLLMVAVLVRAISDGDIGRVEVLLPHLAMMFRGAGCNKYCTEILHFLQNLKHIWTPEFADIMRNNVIICISGQGPGHCMAIDLNIEHLIGYLKILLQAKGMSSTWDRLGNISATIVHIHGVKKKIADALNTSYQSTSHTTPDTSHLVWKVQQKVANKGLHDFDPCRPNNHRQKPTVDILKMGEAKLKSSTLDTFNKKTMAMIAGHGFADDEEDECPAMAYGTPALPDDYS